MPSRMHKSRRQSAEEAVRSKLKFHRSSRTSTELSAPIYENEPPPNPVLPVADAFRRRSSFSPASYGAMNSSSSRSNGSTMAEAKYNPYASVNGHTPPTIRTVPSFEASSDTSSDSPSARHSGFSSSTYSRTSDASYVSHSQNGSTVRLKSSADLPTSAPMSSSNTTIGPNGNASDPSMAQENRLMDDASQAAREGSPQWDSSVGKAGLGKTGRVINKLVSDNDALKRDLKVERIKAEEAKQQAKMIEEKMERMAADYESRLLEASVTKTLLSRKERQVENLQTMIELEKKRAAEALEREKTWRSEMEKSRQDANVQVEEAKMQAAMYEGRYNAIASHWKEQGDQLKKATSQLRAEMSTLNEERRKDDEKINTLRDLCDQQDGNIRDLKRQKDEMGVRFEEYKNEQEAALRHIKTSAKAREEEQERTIEETKRVLGELRWALNVKKNVRGAE